MAATNRLRVTAVRETTLGVTPDSPRMRTVRLTGESLVFTPNYVTSDEIRSDRMNADSMLVGQAASGGIINMELTYPDDESPLSEFLGSAFFNPWTNTPTFFNDGTPDSVVTDAGTTAHTYVVASGGDAVVEGHVVRATGFANAANNAVFVVASSTGTTIVGPTGLALSAETAPPGTAKLKVVGFAGTTGDITATSTGLASTSLDFTTLGLGVGQWIKIGGTATADKFATAALNDWARITGIATNALSLDNLPSGWTTDSGTGKTIKVWFGDTIKNGTTQTSLSIEKGFLDQQTPTYIVTKGQTVDSLQVTATAKQKIAVALSLTGMSGAQSTTSQDNSPDAATTGAAFAGNANVGRIGEAGSLLTSPNWSSALDFTIKNNLRALDDVTSISPAGISPGECTVTGNLTTYFGDNTLLAKFYAGTPSSLNCRFTKNSQAMVWQFPRIMYTSGGDPQAQAKNQDITTKAGWSASADSLTNAVAMLDRLEYFEI